MTVAGGVLYSRIIPILLIAASCLAFAGQAAPPEPGPADPEVLEAMDEACWNAWTRGETKMLLLCKDAANHGGGKSLFVWAMVLNERGDYVKSMQYLKDSIRSGFYEAYAVVGDFYLYGGGGLKMDHCKAKEVYRQGYEKHNPSSARAYARSILTGICEGPIDIPMAWGILDRYEIVLDGDLQHALATGYFTMGERIEGAAWAMLAVDSRTMDSHDLDVYLQETFTAGEREAAQDRKAGLQKLYGKRISNRKAVYWYEPRGDRGAGEQGSSG